MLSKEPLQRLPVDCPEQLWGSPQSVPPQDLPYLCQAAGGAAEAASSCQRSTLPLPSPAPLGMARSSLRAGLPPLNLLLPANQAGPAKGGLRPG